MDILIGTKNSYKVGEITSLLDGVLDLRIHLLKDQNFEIKVEEDGSSLKENAIKKAIAISKKTNYLTLASDGGVDIPGLGDKWDILRNQRIVGEQSTDIEKAKKLLNMMKGLKGEDRKVEYFLALAIAKEGKLLWVDEGIMERGHIVEKLPDENIPMHRWMGHLWYYREFEKVFNKLDEKQLERVREQSKDLKARLQNVLLTNTWDIDNIGMF